jgi:uncharacterized ubiquitin-like protein YukD
MGDMLLVHAGQGDLNGIAIKGDELFVADQSGNIIKVYNKATMSSVALREFSMDGEVGQLSPDNQGGMWMLRREEQKLIRFSITNGEILPQEIAFSSPMVVSTFFVDTLRGRILVADNGIAQNIKVYTDIYTAPIQRSIFGTENGILSGVQGKFEDLKLFDIRGLGVDEAGNIYVANAAPNNSGSVLQSYSPDGNLLWDRKGLVFTATACADPQKLEEVYTFDKKMVLDYSKTTPGSEWSFDAYTLNRFKYPDDPRLHGNFWTSAWIKYIDGKKFLFATDMYASVLAGFRFNEATDGEIAIPCLFMNVGGWDTNKDYPIKLGSDKDFIWMDMNGDGAIQEDEFTFKSGFDNPYSMAIWVDIHGNIWKGVREKGIRFVPLKEVNENGVPIYDFEDSKLLDIANGSIGVNGVKRLVFDAEKDELYIAGFSNEKPDKKTTGEGVDSWWCMGSTVCMYKDVLKTITNNISTDFKYSSPTWRIFVPFFPDGDPGGSNAVSAKSLTVEGDFLFIATAQEGKINVYKRSNGEYLGQIAPTNVINYESGWTDIDYAINVNKTNDEYRIFIEENAFAKVVLYRVESFETEDTFYPDLTVSDVTMLNSNNQKVTHPKVGEMVHFKMTVKNSGPGATPEGSQFKDGISLVATVKIKNLITNKTEIQLLSDTCTTSLKPNQTIQLLNYSTTKPLEWAFPKGKFEITTTINPFNKFKECTRDNNSVVTITNSFDTVYIMQDPKDLTVSVNGNARFSCEVLGNEPIIYKWYVDGVEQNDSNSPDFSLTKVSSSINNAKIKVEACNALGCKTSKEATLKVDDPYGASKLGYLLRQVWYDMVGTKVDDLLSNTNYPDKPDSITFISKFETPTNIADRYATKVSGWLIAPQSGEYIFRISSDDNGSLWLSSDSIPENLSAAPICYVPEWSDPRQFDKFSEQTSSSISLEAGKEYYVEAIFKEDSGGDNLAVEWTLPDGTKESPIPSSRLAFYTGNPPLNVQEQKNVLGKLVVYPTLATEHIFIKSTGLTGIAKISISDLSGRMVKTEERILNGDSILKMDVSNIKPGIYYLTMSNKDRKFNSRFIISK